MAFELGVYGSSQDFFELVFEVQKHLLWCSLFWNQALAHYLSLSLSLLSLFQKGKSKAIEKSKG